MDYTMPQGSKLKYAQMFNNLDKNRVGVGATFAPFILSRR